MEAAEAKVQKVLEGTKQFQVPHYQRPYSWREREWKVLWEDLLELVDDPEAKPHFLGSIVTAPGRAVPEGVEKRLLIDGQQRLTTVVLLLAIIRDRAGATGNVKLADKIGDLLTNRHEDGSDHYKLLPTQGETVADSDRDALVALIEGRELQSSSGIFEAKAYFAAKLSRPDAPNLEALQKTITGKLTLVSIILDQHDNPHRIFESLNGKGRPLSQADLIRNYFFMRLPEAVHADVYRTLWQPMQRRLGEENLTEFVRHYLTHFGQAVKESDIYSTLKERVDDSKQPAIEHLQELATFAVYYEVLLNPEKAANSVLRERLQRLQRLEVTVAYPFILPAYADFVTGRLAPEQLTTVLDTLETYLVRRFVCGVSTKGLNNVFTPLYQQVKKEPDFVEGTRTILAAKACPRDTDFRDRLENARLYSGGSRRDKTSFILGRLEVARGHKERVDVSKSQIEHVMPQTLTPWWKDHLGEEWEEVHEQLLHTLGNLTLTSYNQELSNRSYPEKRKGFGESHIDLNRYFADVENWNEGEINRRADQLADLALGVWPYFGPEPLAAAARPLRLVDDVTSTLPIAITFRGQRVPVRSWREVLTATFEQILSAEPDAFPRILKEMGSTVGMDPAAFRQGFRLGRLSNGAYLDLKMSATAVHRSCLQALDLAGVGPDEWQVERVSLASDDDSDDSDEPTETKQLQLEFWTQVRASLDAAGSFKSLQAARPRYWFNITIGRSGFWLLLSANVAHDKINVKFMVDDNEANSLATFEQQRSAIEAEIGAELEWNPYPDKKQKSVVLTRPMQFADRSAWPDAIEWLTSTAVAFKKAFAPRVAALD